MSTASNEPGLRKLAGNLYTQARPLSLPQPLIAAIDREYERVVAVLR